MEKMTVSALQQMKRDGKKIVGVVAWDYQIAQIADRAGADLVSVGDSVGKNLWGHATETEITVDEMLVVCKAVRRGVKRAVVSCDIPDGPVRLGAEAAIGAARRLIGEGGADIVKVNANPGVVRDMARAGIPVFAEFHGGTLSTAQVVDLAKEYENAGAMLLNFRHSGPEAGPKVVQAVPIPVIGGQGGGPWLDGRLRMAHAAIGYAASAIDSNAERYANVAKITLDALIAYSEDVRAGRQLKGQHPG